MRVYRRLCYLCYQNGEIVPAVGWYTPHVEMYDVCERHLEMCENEGHRIHRFEDEWEGVVES